MSQLPELTLQEMYMRIAVATEINVGELTDAQIGKSQVSINDYSAYVTKIEPLIQ